MLNLGVLIPFHQGLFYVTHQIFLLSRGIYIVVLDLTKGLEHRLKATRKDRLGKDVTDSAAEQTVGGKTSCISSN